MALLTFIAGILLGLIISFAYRWYRRGPRPDLYFDKALAATPLRGERDDGSEENSESFRKFP